MNTRPGLISPASNAANRPWVEHHHYAGQGQTGKAGAMGSGPAQRRAPGPDCKSDLVQTGLDLNAFTTLIFYDTGYKLFTLRQASRRSWRINQTAPRVEVYMFYYRDTMQHKAIKLMASKLAVAGIIEGSFSEEGLAAMSECEDMTT